MEETIQKAIDTVMAKIRTNSKSEEDLRFSQAALNLAHVAQVLSQVKPKSKGTGT